MFEFGALFRSPTADRDYSTLFLKYLQEEEAVVAATLASVSTTPPAKETMNGHIEELGQQNHMRM